MSADFIYQDEHVAISKSADAFIVVHGEQHFVVPFAKLATIEAYPTLRFVGAFYDEGWDDALKIGALPFDASRAAARAAEEAFKRPWKGTEVEWDELFADPSSFNGMVVHVRAAWVVGENEATLAGRALVRAPAHGAAVEQGASMRKLSGFWSCDGSGYGGDYQARLDTYYVDPPLDVPHHRCTSGPTRLLLSRGHLELVEGPPVLRGTLLNARGLGAYAGATFEHPLLQWFEEFRSISVFTWAQWLMSDDELEGYCSWELSDANMLDANQLDWGFLRLPVPIVQPGVLRSSARAIAVLCDWPDDAVDPVVYADVFVATRPTPEHALGQLVDVDNAPADLEQLHLAGEAIRRMLAVRAESELTVDPVQGRFVRGAFRGADADPTWMTTTAFPILPSPLRTTEIDAAYETLHDFASLVEQILRISDAPPTILCYAVRRMQTAANDLYARIIRHLYTL